MKIHQQEKAKSDFYIFLVPKMDIVGFDLVKDKLI